MPNSNAKNDQLLLVVASSAALVAAGLDMGLIDAVPLPPSSLAGDATNLVNDSPSRILIGRLRTANEESVDMVRSQLLQLSQALEAIGQMPQEEIALIVEQLQPAVEDRDRDRFKHEYGVLTVEEMAERMKCTPEMIREEECAGEIFAARAPGRAGGPLYPKFQLNECVAKSLLKQILLDYREAGVNTTLLWSFLRTPQNIFAGWTAMAMMLGASPPAFAALTPQEWRDAFLDVVAEELSRVR
ncbi:MAG: hypothetical protein V4542_02175 [Pseudomonadota bacterium]